MEQLRDWEGFSSRLLGWYHQNKRALPWRGTSDPYRIWVSEIMLQQTRVEAVRGYYERFLSQLPTVADLANCEEDVLLKLWEGLGYYSRVRNLQKAAKVITSAYRGAFPTKYDELIQLPGIGPYTAGAIASIAFGEPVIAMDGNLYRIFSRLVRESGFIDEREVQTRLRDIGMRQLPLEAAGDYNQALMDLGATICIPNGAPLCDLCPVSDYCKAREAGDMLQYPKKKPKKARAVLHYTVLMIESCGRYLLKRRTEKGVLSGMLGFPMLAGTWSEKEIQAHLQREGFDPAQITSGPKAKHIFTHLEWHMTSYRIALHSTHALRVKEDEAQLEQVWATPTEIEERHALPSAFRTYVNDVLDR